MSNEFIQKLEDSLVITNSQHRQYFDISKKLNSLECKIGNIICIIQKEKYVQYSIQNKETKLYLIYYNNEILFVPKQNTDLFKNHSSFLLIADKICVSIIPYKSTLKEINEVLCIHNEVLQFIPIYGIIHPKILTMFTYQTIKEEMVRKETLSPKKSSHETKVTQPIVNVLTKNIIPLHKLHIVVTSKDMKYKISNKYTQNIIDYSKMYNDCQSNVLCYLYYIIDYYDKLPDNIIFLGNIMPFININNTRVPLALEMYIHNTNICSILDECISKDEKKTGVRKISEIYKNKKIPMDSAQNDYDFWKLVDKPLDIHKFNITFFLCTYLQINIANNRLIKYSSNDQYSVISSLILNNSKQYYNNLYNRTKQEPNLNKKKDFLRKTFLNMFLKK